MATPRFTPTKQAIANEAFLASSAARGLRILAEYEEPMLRLKRYNVQATILFFGSARAKSRAQFDDAKAALEAELAAAGTDEEREKVQSKLSRLNSTEWMVSMFDKVAELSRRFTEWAVDASFNLAQAHKITGVTRNQRRRSDVPSYSVLPDDGDEDPTDPDGKPHQTLVVCTGGGPGFMEAANMGAAQVPGARNMGMGITLPFEEGLNPSVSDELAFEFKYFFSRKFFMVFHCQALVVAPGGLGTMDELFEVLTLKQTGKVQQDLPVVLLGTEFWRSVVNWDALVQFGTISRRDYDDLFITDGIDEAFEFVTSRLRSGFTGSMDDGDLA